MEIPAFGPIAQFSCRGTGEAFDNYRTLDEWEADANTISIKVVEFVSTRAADEANAVKFKITKHNFLLSHLITHRGGSGGKIRPCRPIQFGYRR